ncbi:MAG TPA: cysteine--tRNA ligase, partial [bacterium]|nr:cysteine--tRNA ligase [bacterium]
LAEWNEKNYFKVMDALNIKRASVYPRATEYIGKMVELISGLMEKGHAYQSGGDVFFDALSFGAYGILSNKNLREDRFGSDEAPDGKKHPADFALWKSAKPGEPSWDSPWGKGRPGWHIECSTMAVNLAGATLDIHGGGYDLVFPHHENEIAQSECYTGKKFVRYWLHNGFVEMDKEKMSKSLGNVIAVSEILEKHGPDALRLFFLSAHYKMPVSYSDERVAESEKALDRFDVFFSKIEDIARRTRGTGARDSARELKAKIISARDNFIAAMDDDFNTPQAIAEIFSLIKNCNSWIAGAESEAEEITADEAGVLREAAAVVRELGNVLGLFGAAGRHEEDDTAVDDLVELLIRVRKIARDKKDWAVSDMIRDELAALGFTIEDGQSGTTWRKRK